MGPIIYGGMLAIFTLNVKNILQNIVSPIEHCYDSEYCYHNMVGLANTWISTDDYGQNSPQSLVECTKKEEASYGRMCQPICSSAASNLNVWGEPVFNVMAAGWFCGKSS
jgi:hypothetical protein